MNAPYSAVDLAQRIEDTVQKALAELQSIDPDTVIYRDSGWTVKDIVGHLLAWDQHTLRSLQAYSAGSEYCIPGYVDYEQFNHENREMRKDLPYEPIYADWGRTGEQMAAVIRSFTPEQLAGEMKFPAGERAPAGQLAREIYEHTELHMGHIRAALATG